MSDKYRILSIDGGGIKGIFPASFLAAIEENISGKTSEYFDLIVGSSTGGILALGIGLGYSAKEMVDFYKQLGPEIFKGNGLLKCMRRFIYAKYDNGPLKQALEKKYGKRKLGASLVRLVIPSFNIEKGEIHVYKTAHHERFKYDYKESVVDVAMATAAAPTYFPSYRGVSGIPLCDGGLWANNPIDVAVVEAIGVLNWPANAIKVLSLGCTATPFDLKKGRNYSVGITYWINKLPETFMAGQSSSAIGIAKILAGNENIIRVDPIFPNGRFKMDSIKEIESLAGLGRNEARILFEKVKDVFFDKKVDLFVPYHKENEHQGELK